jgi:hypothetical protein
MSSPPSQSIADVMAAIAAREPVTCSIDDLRAFVADGRA